MPIIAFVRTSTPAARAAGYRDPEGSVLCAHAPHRDLHLARRRRLVLALDEHLGPPVDSYLNGSQTWITDDGPGGESLEWRLHPVAGYRLPRDLSHYDLWEQVVGGAVGGRRSRRAAPSGSERAHARARCGTGSSASRRTATTSSRLRSRRRRPTALGRPPDAVGLVDHERIGTAWEQAERHDVDRRDGVRRAEVRA